MAQFKAFAPNVEVNGATVNSVVEGMGAFKVRALQILTECGITNPENEKWYSQTSWLNAFKIISESIGSSTLYSIGMKIPENAKFPPEINSIEKALASVDVAYHMNHRGGFIGTYKFQSTGERSGVMVCTNPYPDDFDRGIIEAMARKFKPKDSGIVKVVHDDSALCRKKGADSCTYKISW